MPYHPETKCQCNIIGTLESDDKQHWKDYLPTLVHVYNCTKSNATDLSSFYLMYGCKPRLPIDIRFGLTSSHSESHFQNKFVAKLSAQLQRCYDLAI